MWWVDGEWTVVKRRSRKERQQADRGFNSERQQRQPISIAHAQHQFWCADILGEETIITAHAGTCSNRTKAITITSMLDDIVGARRSSLETESNTRDHGKLAMPQNQSLLIRCLVRCDRNMSVLIAWGFEVCGMLEDVYVAKKLNNFGAPYGFVKFSNVRDVNKLSKALNAVYFSHFRVRARLARFDRNEAKEDRNPGTVKDGHKEGKMGLEKDVENLIENGKVGFDSALGETGTTEDVRVGDIVVRIGTLQEPTTRMDAPVQEAGLMVRKPIAPSEVAKEKGDRILIRNFRTKSDDVQWAQNGLVETVINGEAVPVVQNRITDAGFHNLIIIPMGADKGFIRSAAGADALTTINSAKDFFTLVFSNWMRFLRADSVSVDRDRLDFARVLIATPELEIIKRVENILVDGSLSEIKIVEEWGYSLGDDTCLFEEESDVEGSGTDNEVEHINRDNRHDVDLVVEKLVNELVEDEDPELQENQVEHFSEKQDKIHLAKERTVEKGVQNNHLSSPSRNSFEVDTSMHSDFQGDCRARVVRNGDTLLVSEAHGSSSICNTILMHL
ncbi:hypothetical protein TSUD_364460 [Trifolium subterraneum]|uniref:DUF4283 domain-containing protein n=1 Tax=Trifolium subterraneum TaxID=3900 RepID=A0A2Z6N2U2_TRISU|nr:hypothetical protein TSUD_364460 [Trifolium subterraneum]